MEIQDFTITRGDTWERTMHFYDEDGCIDISGWTVFFTCKEKVTDVDASAKISKTITVHSDPTRGESIILLTSTDTNLTPGSYIYDIQIKSESGSVLTIVTGNITIQYDVTQRTS